VVVKHIEQVLRLLACGEMEHISMSVRTSEQRVLKVGTPNHFSLWSMDVKPKRSCKIELGDEIVS
jgi:hypothetical protein